MKNHIVKVTLIVFFEEIPQLSKDSFFNINKLLNKYNTLSFLENPKCLRPLKALILKIQCIMALSNKSEQRTQFINTTIHG